jgi:hypothetical protein
MMRWRTGLEPRRPCFRWCPYVTANAARFAVAARRNVLAASEPFIVLKVASENVVATARVTLVVAS